MAPSPWRNCETWAARLREDEATLAGRLTASQEAEIRRIVDTTDRGGQLDFLVVYGSVSRGQQRLDSDLDIYYETSRLTTELEEADPDSRWHVFGVPSGALLESLRRGDEFAFDLVTDALVVCDREHFRDLVVALDEEELRPVADRLVDARPQQVGSRTAAGLHAGAQDPSSSATGRST